MKSHPFILTSVLLAAAGLAAAQPAAPLPIPPRQTGDLPAPEMTREGVAKWLQLYIRANDWTILAADAQAVAMGSPEGVQERPDGALSATIRHEYYKAVRIQGKAVRSTLQARIFDCAGKRQKVVAMDIYEMNNLTGERWTAANREAAWAEPPAGSLRQRVLERVCSVATDANRVG